MLKLLSKKIALQWIILIGLFAFAVYTIITKSNVANPEGTPYLFKCFASIFFQYKYLGKSIIISVLFFHILFLQYYFKKNEYVTKNSFLPVCYYLSILLLTKSLTIISPFFFTLFFFLIIICIDLTGTSIRLKNNVFWTGILIALATCFDLSSIILLLIVIVTLIINQFSRIKETGILLLGFILLYFYFFSFHFFIYNLDEWLLTFQQIKILGVMSNPIENLSFTMFSLISLGIIYLFFIVKFKLISDAKVQLQRNRIITLNTRAVLIMACILLSNSSYPDILGYLFVHLSIYLSILAYEKNPLYINDFITIITLIALWH
ncbi:MAG: hypothetical protein LBU83_09545 [Bacteroidales bacterium]|jgi:hypothetical protein|nr:hypothetical protein [Bacteroidales bacterium]